MTAETPLQQARRRFQTDEAGRIGASRRENPVLLPDTSQQLLAADHAMVLAAMDEMRRGLEARMTALAQAAPVGWKDRLAALRQARKFVRALDGDPGFGRLDLPREKRIEAELMVARYLMGE
jgi:hypothetical protein